MSDDFADNVINSVWLKKDQLFIYWQINYYNHLHII